MATDEKWKEIGASFGACEENRQNYVSEGY